MKPEIEDLIDIYKNIEKYKKRIVDVVKLGPISAIAEALNVHQKISFKKERQRAEILKQNKYFLKELSGIKNRLGEKFFILRDEISEPELWHTSHFFSPGNIILLNSDFAEPKIVIEAAFPRTYDEFYDFVYYLPSTTILGNGYPESEIDERDTFFEGRPLEWVIVPNSDLLIALDNRDPRFKLQCKREVFKRYEDKWKEFLGKWHISTDWSGDLKYLHVHSLPSLIVERDDYNHNLPVVIRLGPWATTDDIKRAWPRVEEIMKGSRLFRERESEDKIFIRDMAWFRMNKEESISPSKIARYWAKEFSREIDFEVIEKITRDEDSFKDVPIEDRLQEILSDDPKMDELKGRFAEARKAFIRNGLGDKVKKSIKATAKKIERQGSEEWDRSRLRSIRQASAPKTEI
jgi:hypothetical protein